MDDPTPAMPATLTWVGSRTGNLSNGTLFGWTIGSPDDTAEEALYLLAITGSGSTGYRSFNWPASGGAPVASSTLPVTGCVVSSVLSSAGCSLYLNGVPDGGDADDCGGSGGTAAYLGFAAYRSDWAMPAIHNAGMVHRCALTAAQIAMLHADPFCMLRR